MKELVLLKYKNRDIFGLKKDLEAVHENIRIYDAKHNSDIEGHPIKDAALLICRVETDEDPIVDDALRIASENFSPILFILSRPELCSYDRITSTQMAWYIKEPYSINELKSKIREATSSSNLYEWNYQLLNDSAKDVLFSMGPTGKILYVSPSVEKLSGFSQEEVLNKGLKELVTEETFSFISGMIGTFCSRLKTDEPVRSSVFDIEILCKDGSTAWVELAVNPVFGEDKNFRYFAGTMHDVSMRKNMEENLRIAASCTTDQIYEWDMKTDQLRWLSNIDGALGFENGYISQTLDGWSKRVHPDDLPGVKERIDAYRQNGSSFDAEYRMIKKDGEIRYWKEHGIPVFDNATKEFVRTIGVCSDITEKVKVENSLKEKDEMFRLIAENANDVIWVLGTNGEILYVSPSLKKLRGFTPEEIKNETMEERFTPESAKLVKEAWDNFFEEAGNRIMPDLPQIMEVEQTCKDGSTIWTEMHINPVFDDEDNLKFFLGISRDISERREHEKEMEKHFEMLDSIFDLAPVPMLLLNGKGAVEKMNQECLKIPGVKKETSIGKRAGEVFSCSNSFHGNGCGSNEKCQLCVLHKMEKETFETQKSIHDMDSIQTLKRPDGSQIQVYIQASTAYIKTHDEAKVIMSFDDITERKKAEEEIVRSKIEAEEANRTKSEFLATMSHELRTPLNAIIGYSQILQDENFGELNPKQRKFANHTYTSGKHLLNLINDILDLSKVEAGKMELHYEMVNVNDVMKDVYHIIAPLANKKHIDVDFLISGDIMICADKIRLKQILYNLINNAIKFTPNNGYVSVKVKTYNGDLKVSVSDTGIGMSEKEQEKLFTPFYQADSSTARKYQGTGLGLSIVKKMIEHHGGTIEVESEAGKGSTFTFTIPVECMD